MGKGVGVNGKSVAVNVGGIVVGDASTTNTFVADAKGVAEGGNIVAEGDVKTVGGYAGSVVSVAVAVRDGLPISVTEQALKPSISKHKIIHRLGFRQNTPQCV